MATQSLATVSVRPWVMTTPLGTPVVPEVKRMSEGSSGPSAALRRSHRGKGRRRGRGRGSPATTRAAPVASPLATTIVSSAGSATPAPRAWPRSPCPRKSVTVTSSRARLRTRRSAASAPLNRVFTGTSTAPAAKTPRTATTHSAQLPHQMATRSPGLTPVSTSAARELPGRGGQLGVGERGRPVADGRPARRGVRSASDHERRDGPPGRGRATSVMRRAPTGV